MTVWFDADDDEQAMDAADVLQNVLPYVVDNIEIWVSDEKTQEPIERKEVATRS